MAFKIPYTFIPGTKAKANEVNSNFTSVADFLTEVNTNLITTTNDLNTTKTNLSDTQKLFQERRTKYCVNNSHGTLITTSGTTIYFNSSFEMTTHKGITVTINALAPISCGTLSDGTYNIFVGTNSELEYFSNTIYRQNTEPSTKNINDLWMNLSTEPLFVGKWDGTAWVEYVKVPVGSFTITSGAISATKIFPFNQNGYNLNSMTWGSVTRNNAVDTLPLVIVESYNNGSSWYKVWSDGWIEQGGQIVKGSNLAASSAWYTTITYLKTMKDTKYSITGSHSMSNATCGLFGFNSLTTSGCNAALSNSNTAVAFTLPILYWKVSGY